MDGFRQFPGFTSCPPESDQEQQHLRARRDHHDRAETPERVGRVGDSYEGHGCEFHPVHTGVIAAGSKSVFVNGRRVGRIGDGISCGGSVIEGSPNVFCGG